MSHHPSIIEIYRHHHHDLMISILVILLFVPVRRIVICDNCSGTGIGWCRCGRGS
jgi:hypothetical protein